MKRFAYLLALVALGSPACARDYSFVFRGHDVHIEAARHCRSLSCVSVLIGNGHNRRARDDEAANMRAPAAASSAAPTQARPVPAATRAVPPTVAAQPAPQPVQTPIRAQVEAPAQILPPPLPAPALASAPSPAVTPPAKAAQPATPETSQSKPEIPARTEEAEGDPDSPIGDWKTDSKANQVRIESCGTALCGYVLDAATHTKGETVLVNMRPKNDTEWTGSVYSRVSGNSYYGRMTLKGGKTLRVEACALGAFFCSGNDWTRIEPQPAGADGLISSQEAARKRS